MKKILVVMWITIVVLVGLTLWLLFNPGAFLRRFQYVPKSELEKARADAQATVVANQNESDRKLAESERQIQQRRDDANRIAQEKMQIQQSLHKIHTSSSEFRRQLVAILLDALGHNEPAVRTWATQTVSHVGEPIKEAIPRLTELLQDENESVREAAQKTLTVLASESTGNPRNQ